MPKNKENKIEEWEKEFLKEVDELCQCPEDLVVIVKKLLKKEREKEGIK